MASADVALAAATWQARIVASCALFSGFSRVSTVPAGSFSNAALVGAKTVNGPAPSSVSTRPAACTAATRVVWSLELTAFSTMFLVGYIGAPPTIGVAAWPARALTAKAAPIAIAAIVRFIVSLRSWVAGSCPREPDASSYGGRDG